MLIEFDLAKDAVNLEKHGVSLAVAEHFDWDVVLVQSAKTVKGEARSKVLGEIAGHLYSSIVTPRGAKMRIISLRFASRKERRIYAEVRNA